MTKRILAVLVVLLLAGTVGVLAGCGAPYVAKVGNDVITQQQFDERVADFEAQFAGQIPDKSSDPETYKAFQQDVLDYMITYRFASQYAETNNITVTADEVQKEIDSIKEQSFGGDQAKFDDALKQQGITLDQLKRSYNESMLMQKVYDEVTKDVTVSDADVQTYYDANKTDYFVDESRTARHILITADPTRVDGTTSTTSSSTTSTTAASTDSSTGSSDSTASPSTTAGSTPTASSSTTTTAAPTETDWNNALETANKVRAQLMGGADWTVEAQKYSDDPGSKEKGGDLGPIHKGEMVKEFEDAVFSLKKNEISQPIKTAYGYHIIQVTDITPAKQYALDDISPYGDGTTTVKDDIKKSLLNEKKTESWRSWIAKQKELAGVTYSDDWAPTTTTTAPPTDSTSGAGDSTTTSAGPATTTTAGATITTAAPTTTTAKQ